MKKDLRSENVKKIAEDFPMCITEIKDKDGFGLSNVAATVAELLGLKPDPVWCESMLK